MTNGAVFQLLDQCSDFLTDLRRQQLPSSATDRSLSKGDILGVIAKFVPKRTLSSIEERGAGISQRTKPILERFGRPDVVAIEADVFPVERADMGKQRVWQKLFGEKAVLLPLPSEWRPALVRSNFPCA